MHELSIANNIVEIARNHLMQTPGCTACAIRVKIGALSCVHRDSLYFSFDLITEGTPLEGAELIVEELPVVVFCNSCHTLATLPGIQRFACPTCGELTGDIRQGRELEIDSIEIVENGTKDHQEPNEPPSCDPPINQ